MGIVAAEWAERPVEAPDHAKQTLTKKQKDIANSPTLCQAQDKAKRVAHKKLIII